MSDKSMQAIVFEGAGQPLRATRIPRPRPGDTQALIRVEACGICRTDLHILDGELTRPKLPLVMGHQVVGTVEEIGAAVDTLAPGTRVGVPWLGWTCGTCRFCTTGRENLCDRALFTGYDIDGGYAEYAVVDQRFCFEIPAVYPVLQAAPLLCAGLIGYRALRMVDSAERIGFYGFGSAAHILTQVATHQGRQVFAFTRPGDTRGQEFARRLGAVWAGDSNQEPQGRLDAAIIFAPAGSLVPTALKAVEKGGTVVCAGIHMSDVPTFPYEILWGERAIRSVANLTRRDGSEFLALAPTVPVRTEVRVFDLVDAERALSDLREGLFEGSGVLSVAPEIRHSQNIDSKT